MVRGDADVLEDVGADEEECVAGEGIEGRSDTCGAGEGVEGVVEVDIGHGNGARAERALKEGDVLAFFDGGLGGVAGDEWIGEGHLGEGWA